MSYSSHALFVLASHQAGFLGHSPEMKICPLAVPFVVLLLETTNSSAFMQLAADKRCAAVKLNRPPADGGSPRNDMASTVGSKAKPAVAERHASKHNKWGVDKDAEDEYWFNQKIHTLGNTGFTGAFHAAIAPLSTYMIDALAYKGVNIRHMVRVLGPLRVVVLRSSTPLISLSAFLSCRWLTNWQQCYI